VLFKGLIANLLGKERRALFHYIQNSHKVNQQKPAWVIETEHMYYYSIR